MWEKGKHLARSFKRELTIYQRVLADSRTPVQAKIFLGLAIGYLCMPFDLIPDFIPVIGHLDDVIIVPALVYLGLRFIPPELVAEHRRCVASQINEWSESEKRHFYKCRCEEMVDKRQLDDVLFHETDHKPRPDNQYGGSVRIEE
jgi:uncharacterized membrane protein YkvA (DUF1232 family)